jgi:hypothetical protein
MKPAKFSLEEVGNQFQASVSGTPERIVTLISTIMVEDELCARFILSAVDAYKAITSVSRPHFNNETQAEAMGKLEGTQSALDEFKGE